MVRLTRIYTKSGDKGTTALGTGKRVPKHDLRVEAFGTVDEANAAIGIARLHTSGDADAALARIQNDLFDLGADLCAPEGDGSKERLRIIDAQVERLEQEIDRMNEELAPLNSFVLPGGSAASAHLHLARTIARRAERDMTRLAETEPVNPAAIRYINRLSDHLFVLARWLNDKGAGDVLWKPGANR
ncbi:MAG TPA: cob(I)yrinic acid a,c-diamide adenosyltransferase [Dongiaceae bacterium]|jgi:cob(I)alamin adenosyltransferase|nr:cob(I)yrinic acid a,c-diamide adenosyltransferase [Dongiaceae bacterium]